MAGTTTILDSTNDDKTPLLLNSVENNEQQDTLPQSQENFNHPQSSSSAHTTSHRNEIHDQNTSLENMSKQIGINIDRDRNNNIRNSSNKAKQSNSRSNLKYVALVALVAQNASLVLLMRYVKTRPDKPQFTNSTEDFL